ncbi:hypothetical protein PHYSODRAFT_331128 [Phytophthora sojae]|uniref:Uncharacterized protein n=1 Tax=Phytophthora sojae (strain P6497) TaxID=1094619 RepID=G4ZGN5_PHYSP|nr:hypothetical protein PHYSODRAFT_331128 [Phytophthora sojae]EGZ17117.1 hypothetical protein PHYSODRAFT_331128 [Phytophthora sojae]|eukprot:XP_009526175.1 hypothetical protein PHYSODRAFT_331128 [Phytophthora sojae]
MVGRPQHPVRAEFRVIPSSTKRPSVECLHCQAQFRNAQPGSTLMAHVVRCPELSEPARCRWRLYAEREREASDARRRQRNRLQRGRVAPETVGTSAEVYDYYQLVAKTFISCDFPSWSITNANFRKLLTLGRDDVQSLDRRKVARLMIDLTPTTLSLDVDVWMRAEVALYLCKDIEQGQVVVDSLEDEALGCQLLAKALVARQIPSWVIENEGLREALIQGRVNVKLPRQRELAAMMKYFSPSTVSMSVSEWMKFEKLGYILAQFEDDA